MCLHHDIIIEEDANGYSHYVCAECGTIMLLDRVYEPEYEPEEVAAYALSL